MLMMASDYDNSESYSSKIEWRAKKCYFLIFSHGCLFDVLQKRKKKKENLLKPKYHAQILRFNINSFDSRHIHISDVEPCFTKAKRPE